MSDMWLAIDSGNTRIKWTHVKNGRFDYIRYSTKTNLEQLKKEIKHASEIWISHVGNEKEKNKLIGAIGNHTPFHFLSTQSSALGVNNHYNHPHDLGVDRWLCLLAARKWKKSIIVVSAGTAVTIDYLSAEGNFKGGLIIPGMQLMMSSLSHATPLTHPGTQNKIEALPCSTASAISTGVATAISGAIIQFQQQHAPEALLLLTGGDGEHLVPLLPNNTEYIPHLLFMGMIHFKESLSASA